MLQDLENDIRSLMGTEYDDKRSARSAIIHAVKKHQYKTPLTEDLRYNMIHITLGYEKSKEYSKERVAYIEYKLKKAGRKYTIRDVYFKYYFDRTLSDQEIIAFIAAREETLQAVREQENRGIIQRLRDELGIPVNSIEELAELSFKADRIMIGCFKEELRKAKSEIEHREWEKWTKIQKERGLLL